MTLFTGTVECISWHRSVAERLPPLDTQTPRIWISTKEIDWYKSIPKNQEKWGQLRFQPESMNEIALKWSNNIYALRFIKITWISYEIQKFSFYVYYVYGIRMHLFYSLGMCWDPNIGLGQAPKWFLCKLKFENH